VYNFFTQQRNIILLCCRFAESVKIMVALSILFSYGLQFCVPSEIVWTRLQPWLRKRRQNGKYSSDSKTTTSCGGAVVNTIAGSTMSTATAVTTTSATSVNEKKQLELESNLQDKPMDGAYYVMRGSMILGTGKIMLLFRYTLVDIIVKCIVVLWFWTIRQIL